MAEIPEPSLGEICLVKIIFEAFEKAGKVIWDFFSGRISRGEAEEQIGKIFAGVLDEAEEFRPK